VTVDSGIVSGGQGGIVVGVGVGVRKGVGVDKGVGAGTGLEAGVCGSIGDAEGVGAGAQLMQLASTPRIVTIKIQVVNRKRPFLFRRAPTMVILRWHYLFCTIACLVNGICQGNQRDRRNEIFTEYPKLLVIPFRVRQ